MDPQTVAAEVSATTFSSGVERLLSMIDKFEATADDVALFERIEQEVLELMIAWSNLLQGALISGGVQPLIPQLQGAVVPPDVMVTVSYAKPEAVQSRTEVEDSVLKRMENGLMSRVHALMELDGLTEDEAIRRIAEIDQEIEMPADTPEAGGANGQGPEAQV
jgi:hypothetical protein